MTRAWRALAGAYLIAFVVTGWYLALPDAGNSTAFRALAAGMTVVALVVIGLAWWGTPNRLEALRARFGRLRWVVAGVGLLVLFGFGLELRPELVYGVYGLCLAGAFALAFFTLSPADTPPVPGWPLALIAPIVLLVRARALAAYPNWQVTDEGWVLGWPVSLLETGRFSDWIMAFGGHDVHYYYLPMAGWFRLVGVGFWEGRVFNLGVSVLVIVVTALAARNLYDRATAWTAVATMLSSAVLVTGLQLRHDIGLGLAIAAGLWAYSVAIKHDRAAFHLLAGLFVGWGWFAHYHATLFGVMLALGLYGPRYIVQAYKGQYTPTRGVWLFALGGMLGGGSVFLLQLLPQWEGVITTRQSRTPRGLLAIAYAAFKHARTVAETSPYEFLLIVLALGWAFTRNLVERSLALSVILLHIALGFLASSAWDHYPVPIVPLYGLLIAGMLRGVFANFPRWHVGVAMVLVVNLAFTLSGPLRYTSPLRPQPIPAAEWLLENAPTDATVLAENMYFIWLHEYDFASPISTEISTAARARFETREEAWDMLQPDYIVFDPTVATYGLLEQLRQNGYLDSRGYTLAFEDGPVQVYARSS